MRFVALATDYDGTLADQGLVSDSIRNALRRFRLSGRRLFLVTGRTLPDLFQAFPDVSDFDFLVAENGAVLYNPSTGSTKVLNEAPPESFFEALRQRGVSPLEKGSVIIASSEDQKQKVLETIHELGLELQIIFNKGSLMVLPAGANKATGLQAAASQCGLSLHNIAGIGDAENDHALLAACEFSAAVANALPALKQRVHLVTTQGHGCGVVELLEEMMHDDLSSRSAWLGQPIAIGRGPDGSEVTVPACSANLLAGPSGGGKSTLTTAFLEGLVAAGYQFCAIDPEGDYEFFGQAAVLGKSHHVPAIPEVLKALEQPSQSVIVNLLGLALENRPNFFKDLLVRLQEFRSRTGRPHCIVVDEAHHFLPRSGLQEAQNVFEDPSGLLLITVRGDRLPATALRKLYAVIATRENARETIQAFCSHLGLESPSLEDLSVERGQMLGWRPTSSEAFVFTPSRAQSPLTRHRRKYAEGELSPERSFYFRGAEQKLNLRAANLIQFLNLMEGVDDDTWLFHLRKAEFSEWFRREIKDDQLALEAEAIEKAPDLAAGESRGRFRALITSRYTLPA